MCFAPIPFDPRVVFGKLWPQPSYTHQRQHVEAVEGAKKPETRARRIETTAAMLQARPAKRSTGGARGSGE